jgi:trans-2,3-dihydro-3-hydroxyanthranilate isomerase
VPLAYTILDVFTPNPLEGNQLAVFPEADDIDEALLLPLAREIGFSETVFVYDADDVDARIRIFTPSQELPFAGHPVLGTAVALGLRRGVSSITLGTGNGVVPVALQGNRGRMQQPLPSVKPFGGDVDALFAALGVGGSELPVDTYDNGVRHLYVTLPDEAAVAAIDPDLRALTATGQNTGINCIAGTGARWKTRMFFPGAGVAEDAATGSAAGPLAVHVARHGRAPWGEELTISQGVEINRPSTLYATAHGGPDRPTAVEVAGDVVVLGVAELSFTRS